MPRVSKSPQAFVDLDELAAYIQQDNPEAAHRFLTSAEWTFDLLAAMPQMGKEYRHPSIKIYEFGMSDGHFAIAKFSTSINVPLNSRKSL